MAKIEGIRVKNFGVLKDVALGLSGQAKKTLTPLTVVIGRNGAGKSTLFDAFGFLSDCLRLGVEEACDAPGRGGFRRLVSQGQVGPMEFEILYREESRARSITYLLAIDLDSSGRPYVSRERLRQRRKGQKTGQPFSFLKLANGKGEAWGGHGEDEDSPRSGEPSVKEMIHLEDNRRLGIATLGALKRHPRISAFRRFIEGWYLSYFAPDAARGLPRAGPQKHLNRRGDNLGNVVQYMERGHKENFQGILARIARRIPGIDRIGTKTTDDGRLLLCFNDAGFQDPFYAGRMSDGTLKLFAYMLLLEDPAPAPFLCIEEPENGLYHKLLEILANEFRAHTSRGDSQAFITTHQPYFVNALDPEEVWILEKGTDGFAKARRASDDTLVKSMVAEGLPLGGLWYSDYLDAGQ
jgi:predicted ATPase